MSPRQLPIYAFSVVVDRERVQEQFAEHLPSGSRVMGGTLRVGGTAATLHVEYVGARPDGTPHKRRTNTSFVLSTDRKIAEKWMVAFFPEREFFRLRRAIVNVWPGRLVYDPPNLS